VATTQPNPTSAVRSGRKLGTDLGHWSYLRWPESRRWQRRNHQY